MRTLPLAGFLLSLVLPLAQADAAGTARIQQPDGSTKTYNHVHIRIEDHQRMLLTSSDRIGTLIINKASCTAVSSLLRCLAYSGELDQNGQAVPFVLKSGTIWLNPGSAAQQLPYASTKLAPRGVMMALETKRGTHVDLTGTVDEVIK